jgi:hypothetical protein
MRCLVVLGPMRAWMKWALAGVAIAVIAVGSAFIGAAIDDDKATAAPAANTGVETGRLGHAGAPWQENDGRPWRVTPSPAAEPTPAHPQPGRSWVDGQVLESTRHHLCQPESPKRQALMRAACRLGLLIGSNPCSDPAASCRSRDSSEGRVAHRSQRAAHGWEAAFIRSA